MLGRPARSKTLGVKAKFPALSMSWEWVEVVAWTRRHRNMASDFQRPSSMMASVPTFAQSRAAAPPSRKDRTGGDLFSEDAVVGLMHFGRVLDGIGDVG